MSQSQTASASARPASLPTRRRTALLSDGSYLFEDELRGGRVDAVVITCAAWLLELYELKSGAVEFATGKQRVRASKCFGVLYSPFSITHPSYKNAQGRLIGIADSSELPAELRNSPATFDVSFSVPAHAAEAISMIRNGVNRQAIAAYPSASLLSVRAKRLIDENYLAYPAIARIAHRLGVSHAHLSRQFKSDFQMSPIEYLRRLRVADAPLRLARGEEIINVSYDVGYNDLSRFYKQFRKTTNASPGACKTLLRPQR